MHIFDGAIGSFLENGPTGLYPERGISISSFAVSFVAFEVGDPHISRYALDPIVQLNPETAGKASAIALLHVDECAVVREVRLKITSP